MKKQVKDYYKWAIAFIVILIIVFIPRGIDELFSRFQIKSKFEHEQWLGFLGGYLGAIIGGIATLAAVVITLKKQEINDLQENALITYYDLILGLEDLKKLYYETEFPNEIIVPTKLFFSNDWIKNVAKISSKYKNINALYVLYGDLEMLKEAVTNSNSEKNKIVNTNKDKLDNEISKLVKQYFSDTINLKTPNKLDIEKDLNDDTKKVILDLKKIIK